MKHMSAENSGQKNIKAPGKSLLQLIWPEDQKKRKSALFWSCVFSAFNLAAFIAVGFLCGWTRTQEGAAAGKIAAALLLTLITEILRTFLAGGLSKRFGAWKAGIPVAVFFAAAEILLQICPPDVSGAQAIMSLLFECILPAVCTSVLMTAFVIRGGLAGALFYRIFALLITFVPFQPADTGFGSIFLHVILPLFFIIALDTDWSGEEKRSAAGKSAASDDSAPEGENTAVQAAGPAVGANDPQTESGIKKRKKKTRSLPVCLISAVVILLLIAFLAGLMPWFPAVIATGSMEPELETGDVVIISEPAADDLQVSDIIAFEKDGALVIHRLAEIYEEDGETVYITKGDANNANDAGYITAEDIAGKVILTIPAIGWLSLWFHQTV